MWSTLICIGVLSSVVNCTNFIVFKLLVVRTGIEPVKRVLFDLHGIYTNTSLRLPFRHLTMLKTNPQLGSSSDDFVDDQLDHLSSCWVLGCIRHLTDLLYKDNINY
jgi:hypothetical protein